MKKESVVGKVAYYRLLFEKESKESEVIAERTLTNQDGVEIRLLKMANGDEVFSSSCYFNLSIAPAIS